MNKVMLLAMLLVSLSCNAESIVVADDLGNRVSMASPPARIVSLAPHLTEILFSLDVGDRLIATVRYSDYPEAAKQIPRLGDAFSLSIEAIVGVNPDLILAWSTGGNQRTLNQLRELGFAIYLNESADLKGIASTVRRIGELVGKPVLANRLAADFADELTELKMQRLAGPTPAVFFQISDSQLYTINSQHLIGQGIELCGGNNVFGDLPIMVPLVSLESVIDANPDVILVASPHEAFVSRWTKEWARLKWDGRVRTINASLITRPSLRMLDGIKSMCKLMNE